MFTGEVPFPGEIPLATVPKHLDDPIPVEGRRRRARPASLVPVLRKALAENPDSATAPRAGSRGSRSRAPSTRSSSRRDTSPRRPARLLEALNPMDGRCGCRGQDLPQRSGASRASRPHRRARSAARPASGRRLGDGSLAGDRPRDKAPEPVAILIRALSSEDHGTGRARPAVGGMGPDASQAIPVLLEALRDRVVEVRDNAAKAWSASAPPPRPRSWPRSRIRIHRPTDRRRGSGPDPQAQAGRE